ncbi:MAG TPA: hypothetical protein VGF85_00620, partial [Opitutaceae bacterium]
MIPLLNGITLRRAALGAVLLAAAPLALRAADTPASLNDLLGKSKADLDALFLAAPAGPIPEGNAQGEAVIWSTSGFFSRLFAHFVDDFAWQGKVFSRHPDGTTTLLNKLGPDGQRAVEAKVYATQSWLDGKPCIVLDYSQSTAWARPIRDEIRLVDPEHHLY